jgi:hypothetical protein
METTKHPLSGAKKRYATYLRPESIKALQRVAFERDVPDYDVVQAAVDEYLSKHIPIRLPINW